MIDIAILRAMAAAGAPVEAILAAIEVDQRAEIERVQARRISDRDRKRRQRSRESHAVSRGQTVTPPDGADADPSLTSSLSSSNNLKIHRKEEEKKERPARGHQSQLPEDWEPKESHFTKAAERGLSAGYVTEKADDMRNWAASKGIRRADWDATFHGFLRPKESGRTKPTRINGDNHDPFERQPGESLGQLGRRLASEARRRESETRPPGSFDFSGSD